MKKPPSKITLFFLNLSRAKNETFFPLTIFSNPHRMVLVGSTYRKEDVWQR